MKIVHFSAILLVSLLISLSVNIVSDQSYKSEVVLHPEVSFDPFLNSSIPDWAFAGAYLNYSSSVTTNSISGNDNLSGFTSYTIESVNAANQTVEYNIKSNLGSTGFYTQPGNLYSNFTGVTEFPAFSSTEMTDLKEKIIPPEFLQKQPANSTISVNVSTQATVSVGYGTYKCVKIVVNQFSPVPGFWFNSTDWVSTTSGVLVKSEQTVSHDSSASSIITLSLSSTNIMKRQDTTLLYVLGGAIGSAVIIAAILLFYHGRGDRQKPEQDEESVQRRPKTDSSVADARRQELQSLLDKGLITKDYFEESIERLRGK